MEGVLIPCRSQRRQEWDRGGCDIRVSYLETLPSLDGILHLMLWLRGYQQVEESVAWEELGQIQSLN